jgi:hypothetical protein
MPKSKAATKTAKKTAKETAKKTVQIKRPAKAKPAAKAKAVARAKAAKAPTQAAAPTGGFKSPAHLIASLSEPRRSEIARIDQFIRATVPKLKPELDTRMGMLGYGPFHYRYASGREGDAYKLALSSRKGYISLYCCAADARGYVAERYTKRLAKASIGKSCVRFKSFDDLDLGALAELLRETEVVGYGV